jgi:YegS/Rv2252/BmrU family lipid kinase
METDQIQDRQIWFIVNPISGSGKQLDFESYLNRVHKEDRSRYQILYTTNAGEAVLMSQQAVMAGAGIVVAVGGDGTVNEVARSLVQTNVALGIIPAGSGNGLARHLGIPLQIRQAIEVVFRGKVANIDTAFINNMFFVNMAGVGFDAVVARKFAKNAHRGFWGYLRISFSTYFRYRPKKYTITLDGVTIKRRALMVNFANSSQFGYNATIDPSAIADDGLIDVCIVKRIPIRKVFFIVPMLFMKKFDKTEFLEVIRACEIHVVRKKGKSVHLDGDPFLIGKEFIVKINPKSLFVVVP